MDEAAGLPLLDKISQSPPQAIGNQNDQPIVSATPVKGI